MKQSTFLSLNTKDFIKGLLLSVLTSVITIVYTSVQNELDVIISEIDDIPLEIVDRDIIEIPHEKLKNIKANVIMSRQV